MERTGKNGVKYGVLVGLSLLALVTVAFGFALPGMSKFDSVKPVNGVVTVAVAKVSDGSAHYFRLADGGKELKFFIVKGGALATPPASAEKCC